ncbi:MAG TPA: regulatory protein RecX [Alphaproteobacteria bacterium]|nr:regulatory protein RecX [Alphaproteobacteria bacterium]
MTTVTRKPRRGPRKATPQYLQNAALYYLERYASSAENLRRVLMRRVELSARAHDTDRDEGARQVDAIIRRCLDNGLLDDSRYASARVRSLARRGDSPRAIRAKLAQKGVPEDAVEAAFAELVEETPDPELRSAVRLARRRRLGPFRPDETRAGHKDRDLAALARAGFSFDVARRVIEAPDIAALDQLVAKAGS